MQVTLSRQTGRRLQYFVAYTLAKSEGTLGGEYSIIDPYDPKRTYGVLAEDRTHTLNVSWNAFLPDAAQGRVEQPGRSRAPQRLAALGHLIARERHPDPADVQRCGREQLRSPTAYFGTADVVGPEQHRRQRAVAGLYLRSQARRRLGRAEDPRPELHLRAGVRRRTAPSCRRTTSERRCGPITT